MQILRFLRPSTLFLASLAGSLPACDETPVSAPVEEKREIELVARESIAMTTAVFLDLVAESERAHVSRSGPVLDPAAPGWERITQLAGRSPWRAPRVINEKGRERSISWLDSIGGSIFFPVDATGSNLRVLEFWLKPIAQGQRVSVFLDEVPLATVQVPLEGKTFRFNLPGEGLAPGEHNVRFWFRFSRAKGQTRTSAALSGMRLLPEGDAPDLPMRWVHVDASDSQTQPDLQGISGPALLAGAPAQWSYYLVPPRGARLKAEATVKTGDPVVFAVQIEEDGAPLSELLSTHVSAGQTEEIDVDLDAYAGRPVRLNLETRGQNGPLERAAWRHPILTMPVVEKAPLEPVRNVILWSIDGLRSDRVSLGRQGERASTPNLDLLASEGAASVDVWSGGGSAATGHRRLLAPVENATLLDLLQTAKQPRTTGIISATNSVPNDLSDLFKSHVDLQKTGDSADTSMLLTELESWLDVRGRQPFFLYIATEDPKLPVSENDGYVKLYETTRPLLSVGVQVDRARRDKLVAYDAQVSVADYWIGQVLGLLKDKQLLDNTAILITGSVGQDLGEFAQGDVGGLLPQVLQVPLIVWHPNFRHYGLPRPLGQGGDLYDVARMVLAFVGVQIPTTWPGSDIHTSLFSGVAIPPKPSHAHDGNLVAARFGPWVLRGLGNRQIRLWHTQGDRLHQEEVTGEHPITLRTLRNYMLDVP